MSCLTARIENLPAAPKCRHQTLESTGIPTSLLWGTNKAAKTWQLIEEIGKMENYKVLFGKQEKKENTPGESKTSVFKRMGEYVWPEYARLDRTLIGQRTKNQV